MNIIMTVCCIGIVLTYHYPLPPTHGFYTEGYEIMNIHDKSYIGSFGMPTTTRNKNINERMNDCRYDEYYFSGDYVRYLIPVGSNMSYNEAINAPLNSSLKYIERTYQRTAESYTFTPIFNKSLRSPRSLGRG